MRLVPFKRSFVRPVARLRKPRPTAWDIRDSGFPEVLEGARDRARERMRSRGRDVGTDADTGVTGAAAVVAVIVFLGVLALVFVLA